MHYKFSAKMSHVFICGEDREQKPKGGKEKTEHLLPQEMCDQRSGLNYAKSTTNV